MLLWVLQSFETVSSRTGRATVGSENPVFVRGVLFLRLTGPELVFVLEVIRNLVFHAMNRFMSSLRD